ncbi:uncharacterized protein JCM15063_002214 [Sporobolomyces koalae]|uniref:uncharacterized protein n=1 Tax=Sporobolomyces koalae TaxID=500713 RepID=UPI00316DE86D
MTATGTGGTPSKVARRTPRPVAAHKVRTGALAWAMDRQLELSFTALTLVLAGNAWFRPEFHLSTELTPAPSYHLKHVFSRFLFLSFRIHGTNTYYKGRDDAFIIAWWVIAFWFLREALMKWAFIPLARRCGIKQRRSVVRFAEQSWMLLYPVIFWSLGMYINQTSDYRSLRTAHFWKGYPHDALPALTKWYYLVQTAFWIQQIIVLNLEARRKDYLQMFAHHIITTLLVSFSYVLNFTRVGNSILCTMDFTDILLPLAKLFKYAGAQKCSDATFAFFLVSWIATRHVVYGIILWSVLFEAPVVLEYDWRVREGYFFSKPAHAVFCVLLAALQVILCIWLVMILRVLWNILRGGSAEDTRSDDEDDGAEDVDDDELDLDEVPNDRDEPKKDR